MPCLLKPNEKLNGLTSGCKITSSVSAPETISKPSLPPTRSYSVRFINTITNGFIPPPKKFHTSVIKELSKKKNPSSDNSLFRRRINPLKTSFACAWIASLIIIAPYPSITCSSNSTTHPSVKPSTSGFIHTINSIYPTSDSGITINFWMFNRSKRSSYYQCTFNS